MALPSQYGRSDYNRSHMFRRKRLLPKLPVLIVGGLIVASIAWFVWPDGNDDNKNDADGPMLTSNDQSSNQANQSATSSNDRNPDDSSAHRVAADNQRNQQQNADRQRELERERADQRRREAAAETARRLQREKEERLAAARLAEENAADSQTTAQQPPESTSTPNPPLLTNPTETQSTASSTEVQQARQITQRAVQLEVAGELVKARQLFTQAYDLWALPDDEQARVRERLNKVNEQLVFSPLVLADDPFSKNYKLKSGDSLERVVSRNNLDIDWRLLKRINHIRDERRIQAGNGIKIVTGPFHAVIDKTDYRLDLYMGEGRERVFVQSFPVGLGKYNRTPVGFFEIGSKLINPEWIDPDTRQRFLPDDPMNPIGERWLELVGTDAETREYEGYGIHGTIEPDTIGQQQSRGCVRMLPNDVAIIYETLIPGPSTVEIRD